MYKKNLQDSICSRSFDENSNKSQMNEQQQPDENIQILIDSDIEDEFTSSGVSEDEEEEENDFEEGNLLQSLNQYNYQNHLFNITPNVNITFIHSEGKMEVTQINNDHLIAQTMAVLAAKHRHIKPLNSIPTKNDILSFIGPCPLYSLSSSFGLDMHHGLSYFPCRNILTNSAGYNSVLPLWQHLTSYHNLNLSSSSILISHLLLHGYSSSTPILFNSTNTNNILRTTPRYSLMKKCPLTHYGIYGIEFEHGTRLCSGYTYNTNIYLHLISFHKMTHEASLRLSRAIAFHDKEFQFQFNDIIVNESIKCPLIKFCQIKTNSQFKINQYHLIQKKNRQKKPVKNISN